MILHAGQDGSHKMKSCYCQQAICTFCYDRLSTSNQTFNIVTMPASRSAIAKMFVALFPSSGVSSDCAWERSPIWVPVRKNVDAASKIIALFIAHPTIIEKKVSKNSYFNVCWMYLSDRLCIWRLRITSECRNRLCGITTAPRTLIAIIMLP